MSQFPKDMVIKKGHLYGERKLRVSTQGSENTGLPADQQFERHEGEICIATLFKGSNWARPRLLPSQQKFAKDLHQLMEPQINEAKKRGELFGEVAVHYGGGLTGLVTVFCSKMISADYLDKNAQVVMGLLEKNRDKIQELYEAACRDDEKFKRAQDAAKRAIDMNSLVRQASGGNVDALAQHIYECEELGDSAKAHREEAMIYMTVGRGHTVPEAPDTTPPPRVNAQGQIEVEIGDAPSVVPPGTHLKINRPIITNAAGEVELEPHEMREADPQDGHGRGTPLKPVDPSWGDRLRSVLRRDASDAPEPQVMQTQYQETGVRQPTAVRDTHPNNASAANAIAAASMEFAMAEAKRGLGGVFR